jgi:macrolide transport system ATP-binding/permease protein
MSRAFLSFHNVAFSYDTSPEPLFTALDVSFPAGWTGVVGPNGAGKTTLLSLAAGIIAPTAGAVRAPGRVILCEQRTDDPPPELEALLSSDDSEAADLRGRLSLRDEGVMHWPALSHGERKRAQIACALWTADAVLCLDEPTNHVDEGARRLLADALSRWRGIGLLVSHDRELLDQLCSQCLFLDPPRVVLRPGTWTEGDEQAAREDEAARRQAGLARAEVKAVARRLGEARREAGASRKRLSKKGIAKHDQDSKSKIDAARISGKDAVAARLARRLEANLDRAEARAARSTARPARELGLWFASEAAHRDTIVRLSAGELPLGPGRVLRWPDLSVEPRDRIALVGPNGSGKSTLLRSLLERGPVAGDRLLSLPQEISRDEAAEVTSAFHGLPRARRGRALTVVNLLGTEPERILATSEPSPGEVRKMLIAMGIERVPHLIVLDEPTNHLDLPSIRCLEDALSECSCALLLASHDRRFLARLCETRWEIEAEPGGGVLRVR